MQAEQIIIAPVLTEKAMVERVMPRYVFKVNLLATKVAIAQAIEKIYKVQVVSVNTTNVRGKRKVLGRSIGRTNSWKKAYVRLAAKQKIEELEL